MLREHRPQLPFPQRFFRAHADPLTPSPQLRDGHAVRRRGRAHLNFQLRPRRNLLGPRIDGAAPLRRRLRPRRPDSVGDVQGRIAFVCWTRTAEVRRTDKYLRRRLSAHSLIGTGRCRIAGICRRVFPAA